jgi:hypothetical protein
MKPLIVTCFNNDIDERLVKYQSMVINSIKKDIPFVSFKYPYHHTEMLHGDILNKLTHKMFYENGADCILIIDVDCIPLSYDALETTFMLAYEGHVVGNIQRSNHLNNNQHVYAASSYVCFSEKTYEKIGRPTMCYSNVGDTVEQVTFNAERSGVPVTLFTPTHVESPYNEHGDYWDLADGMPKYGIGTTFGYNGKDMTYHLFSSRDHIHNHLFFNKCHRMITDAKV